MQGNKLNRALAAILSFALLVLCLIWLLRDPVFHRNLPIYLSVISCGLLAFTLRLRPLQQRSPLERALIWGLILIAAVALATGFIVAPDPHTHFSYWNSRLLRPILLFGVGYLLYDVLKPSCPWLTPQRLLSAVVVALMAIVVFHLGFSAHYYVQHGALPWQTTEGVYNRARASYYINMLAAILLAEVVGRLGLKQRMLALPSSVLALFIAACCAVTILISTRWGTLGLLGMSALCSLWLLARYARSAVFRVAALLVLLGIGAALGYGSYRIDHARWAPVLEEAKAGWNSPTDTFCFNFAQGRVPLNAAGVPYSHSNYCRASLLHQSTMVLADNPLGGGMGKRTYNALLERKYQQHFAVPHSHHGFIEFGLQTGWSGLALWLAWLVAVAVYGWQLYRRQASALGFMILLFTFSFVTRSLVDNIIVDPHLEQYLFLFGLLLGLARHATPPPSAPTAQVS